MDSQMVLSFKFQIEENGYAVIEGFLTEDEIATLHQAGENLCTDAPKEERKVFSASRIEAKGAQNREEYFLNSSDKVRYFFEDGALDENGNLLVEATKALNKVSSVNINQSLAI